MTGRKKHIESSERRRELLEITPSSVSNGGVLDNLVVANAIDRDLSTLSATSTDNGAGWLKAQFEKTREIHKVIVYYRFYTNWYHGSTGWCEQSVGNFMACVDGHNNVDVSVYQGEVLQKSCGTLQLTYGLEQSDQIYTLICYAEGDNVKLSKNSGRIIVSEVVVVSTGKMQ